MSSTSVTPYRPAQWNTPSPALVLITFPGQGTAPQYSNDLGVTATLPPTPTLYVFDAVMQIQHQQELRKTEHPIQTGAGISDHAFVVPARLVLDVGMSDAMDSYSRPTTWSGSTSKSVSAYQTFLALQFSRIPLTVTTRLRTYSNMIIESLTPDDSYKTISGLRMRVEFGQIFVAVVTGVSVSARSQDTENTDLGVVTPVAPAPALLQQNAAPPIYHPWNSVDPGSFSSVNINQSQSLPAK